MSTPLTVPAPTLSYEDAGGGAAALEKPVSILIAPVTEGSSVLGPPNLTVFGYSVQRHLTNGSAAEVWDDAAKAWVPDQPGSTAKPVALTFRDGDPNPWLGMLVAGGTKDGAGAPAYVKAHNGYPAYSVRGAFTDKTGNSATGPASPPLTFAGASDRNLMVIGPGEDEKPDQATQSRILLKNTNLQEIGGLTVVRDSPGAVVTLSNAAGASVILRSDGAIELRPASGKGVIIAGDVETEHITYRPAGGAAKKTLV
jgi:hypothetical protein